MDGSSVTRPSAPSTREIVADGTFCAQAASVLGCDYEPIRDAFVGEPAEEVLEMVRWALSHQGEEGFDVAEVLAAWAKKRGRGAWSGRPLPSNGANPFPSVEVARALAGYWSENPHELAELLERVRASLGGGGGS